MGSGHKPHEMGPDVDLDSKDILARTETVPAAYVKHVLIGWADLFPVYRGHMDKRAAKRTNAEAAKLAKEVYAKLVAKPDSIDDLANETSEDPGSKSGEPYKVTASSSFVPEFKKLALRLHENEAGIVKTQYGYHVIERVPPPALDPIESADILKRDERPGSVEVRHVLIGWKDIATTSDPRAKKRTREEASKLAKDILAKLQAGADIKKLMKEYSEDPGSKDTGRTYEVSADAPLVQGFKDLGLRLGVGEAGIVKTSFGYHVMQRAPDDKLQSNDILARPVASEKARIKYILLGWDEANTGSGPGKTRTRAALEKLVKSTLAKLATKKATFEDLMKTESEDTQTGPKGIAIDVTMPRLPPAMKMLGQRLKVDEVGVAKTPFGMFIIKRVQ